MPDERREEGDDAAPEPESPGSGVVGPAVDDPEPPEPNEPA